MCLGIPGRIVERSADHPDLARVDVEGVIRDINMALLEDDPPQPGDWILIHLGFALQTMTEAEAADALATMAVLGEGGDDDPFAGFRFDGEDDPLAGRFDAAPSPPDGTPLHPEGARP
jgi:hydrogenase expression/formation protein HypC